MRQSGDYDDFFEWTEEDVRPCFEKTEQLIHKIEGVDPGRGVTFHIHAVFYI